MTAVRSNAATAPGALSPNLESSHQSTLHAPQAPAGSSGQRPLTSRILLTPLVGGLARQYHTSTCGVGVTQGRLTLDEIARHVHAARETLAL